MKTRYELNDDWETYLDNDTSETFELEKWYSQDDVDVEKVNLVKSILRGDVKNISCPIKLYTQEEVDSITQGVYQKLRLEHKEQLEQLKKELWAKGIYWALSKQTLESGNGDLLISRKDFDDVFDTFLKESSEHSDRKVLK
jgi:hypothetical protein